MKWCQNRRLKPFLTRIVLSSILSISFQLISVKTTEAGLSPSSAARAWEMCGRDNTCQLQTPPRFRAPVANGFKTI
jgi:hypothetical protein